MKNKKLISALLAAMTLVSVASCGVSRSELKSGVVASSSSAETSAVWLADKLGESAGSVTVGTEADAERYGVSLDGLRDEGYVIRKENGEAVIFGKTGDGLDRGVRYYAKNFADAETANYTYGEGNKVKKLTIAGNDISEYSIYLAAGSDECHSFAASELQKYIGDACDFYPEIRDTETDRMIVLERVTKDDERYTELGDEGFTIAVKDENLYITGGELRGCMYGVYEFLESYIGYIFLYDYENFYSYEDKNEGMIDYLGEAEHIDIPEGTSETQIPSFAMRDNYDYPRSNLTPDYAVKVKGMNDGTYNVSKYNGYGIMKKACHGIDSSGLYYILTGHQGNAFGLAQPCFTDDEVIETAINHYLGLIQAKIDAGQQIGREICDVDVSQLDSANFCMCERCLEYYRLDGGHVGPVLHFTNAIADAVSEAYPDDVIYVDMLAYWGTSSVPKVTRPRDNVSISYCFYNDIEKNACYAHGADGKDCVGTARNTAVSNRVYAAEFEGWCEIASRVVVWYYPGMWEWCAIPSSTIANLRKDMAYFSSFDSVYGVFMCSGSYDQTEEKLTFYLLNRVMWDADMTEEEYADLIKGYLYVMCGDGYEYIYDYLMSRIEVARNECWTSMAWTDPSERIDLGRVADEFEYYIELFRHAEELACTEAQEKNISLMSRTMYFTGLVAVHTDWYLNGTAEQKEKYTEIYSYFKQLALETGFCLTTPDEPITEEMFDIDRNIAEYFSFNQAPGGSETWWKYN